MRALHGALAAPIVAAVLMATTTATSAAATVSVPSAASGAPAAATAPFPGIWDITTWPEYRAAQAAVEQGHEPWLLDPALVVGAWAAQWTPAPAVHQVGPNTFQVTAPGTKVLYTISGTRPDASGPAPIWVITSITHD